jgi:hypothetical protein
MGFRLLVLRSPVWISSGLLEMVTISKVTMANKSNSEVMTSLRGCLKRAHRANRTVMRRIMAREIHASSVSGKTS